MLDLSLAAKSEGRVLGGLKGHMEPAHVVLTRPHCAQLISVGSDGLVLVWDYDPPPSVPLQHRRRLAAACGLGGSTSAGNSSISSSANASSSHHQASVATHSAASSGQVGADDGAAEGDEGDEGGDRDCWTSDDNSSGDEGGADWRRSFASSGSRVRQKRRRREGFIPPILRQRRGGPT